MRTKYVANGNTAILAISPADDGMGFEEFAYLSVNLGESLDPHEFFLDANIFDIAGDLADANVSRDTGIRGYSGFNSYMLMRLSDEAYESMDVIDYEADDPCAKGIEALSSYMKDPAPFALGEFKTSMPMPSSSRDAIFEDDGPSADFDEELPF